MSQPSDTPESGPSLHILLVDDNAINLKITMIMLKKMGHEVDLVDSGPEALEAVKTTAYDLILMDIQMPDMDGFETSRRIRDPEHGTRNPGMPIIALSARGEDEGIDDIKGAGMNGLLTKPVKKEKLLNLVETHCPASG